MKCPHCEKQISNAVLNKHFASAGGKTSKREITPAQQAKMQAARRKPNAEHQARCKASPECYCSTGGKA